MLDEKSYWIPKPKLMGIRGWSMIIPLIGAGIGDFCFTVIALTYTEIGSFDPTFRLWFTKIGAIALAFGSAVGTLPTVIEIFRASDKPRYTDYIALGINGLTTLAAFVIAFAALLGKEAVVWAQLSALWGPLFFGFLLMLDTIASAIVFGRYLRDYDKRIHEYQKKFEDDSTRLAAWNGLTISPEAKSQMAQGVKFDETGTAIMPKQEGAEYYIAPEKEEGTPKNNTLHCWCGKEVKSRKAYGAHLRIHIREVESMNAEEAKAYLLKKYANTVKNSNFEFPDITAWKGA